LKPAIEACGISTLSQSPMLGFHKQMDNRIKLLEEILSFRMQGVEFDNGDMYVDGHKAASDVRDEFVSVTEKLMDELAQRSEERFSRNAETDLVCRLLLEKKKKQRKRRPTSDLQPATKACERTIQTLTVVLSVTTP